MSGAPSPQLARLPRIEALLAQMTLPEKAGQMTQHSWGFGSDDVARGEAASGGLGSVLIAP
jgi:hypothetical protein